MVVDCLSVSYLGVVNSKSESCQDAETSLIKKTLMYFTAKCSKIQESRQLTITRLQDSSQMPFCDFEIELNICCLKANEENVYMTP